jgi:hypothetical protein
VPVYFPSYFHGDFFGSTPGDFSGQIVRRLPASGHPSLSAFQPFTPPGGVNAVIIHLRRSQVKRKIARSFLFSAFLQASHVLPYYLITFSPVLCSLLSPHFFMVSLTHTKHLPENSGGVRNLNVCGFAAHIQIAVLL